MMTAPAMTVTADTALAEAAHRMVAHQHKILPVVDDERRLVGIVDRGHLLRAAVVAGRS
jgi:CBS domain-containing protein